MSSVSSIAASGMAAATTRLQVAAGNIANASSTGPLPGAPNAAGYPAAYSAQRVDQVAMPGGGTRAIVRDASPGTVTSYDPSAPYADGNGMVAAPNVDMAGQAVQLLTARISFAMNAQVMRTQWQMMTSLIDITA
jgi:flagellar basal-body rod protein FlgC